MWCFILYISVHFRYAARAGHSYGPSEPDIQYELYGPLYKTGCRLAEAGQPKRKLTNKLDACKPFELPLTPELLLRLRAGRLLLHFTRTLTHLVKKGRHRCHLLCVPHWSLHFFFFLMSTSVFFFFFSQAPVALSAFFSIRVFFFRSDLN